ncbi:fructose-2,6-bisphosphatase TIGAR B-like isoform X2 [Centruroides sculpturatus]|uniref:fructose-2,6-bisphosphatase TIGAR B-like isoform X2 n=1 Tax=Centruroides sculpturatus TaxID=218467 RepID=UPI000C6EF64C|nr:fructose-2,6-bisphosphatase TIGAR B-like isoform X2 [Centruroides sculpturatus]
MTSHVYWHNIEVQSQLDIPLSSEGRRQSMLLGQRLQDEAFTHVYTSKLSRAIQTAECILEKNKHSKPEIMMDEILAERSFGELEGKPFKLIREMAKRHNLTEEEYSPNGGETTSQVRQRAASFFEDLCKRLETEESHAEAEARQPVVLLVSHGGFINEFARHLLQDLNCVIPEGNNRKSLLKFSPNASVSKFVVSRKGSCHLHISCIYFYDRRHLDDD